MSLREILDASILEPPPPFPDLDELIARERRRQRRRRWAAIVTGAAGLVGTVAGVAQVAGNLDRAPTPSLPAAPSSPNAAASVPADETPEERYARLSELLRTRVATVRPGATVTSYQSDLLDLFDEYQPPEDGPDTGVGGYDTTMTSFAITTPQGSMDLGIFIARPLMPSLPPPTAGVLGSLFGGCAGEWSTATADISGQDTCTERPGPGGTAVSIAERHYESVAFVVVTVAFPEGGVVTATIDPAATLLSPDDLVEILADPGFVA